MWRFRTPPGRRKWTILLPRRHHLRPSPQVLFPPWGIPTATTMTTTATAIPIVRFTTFPPPRDGFHHRHGKQHCVSHDYRPAGRPRSRPVVVTDDVSWKIIFASRSSTRNGEWCYPACPATKRTGLGTVMTTSISLCCCRSLS